MPKKITLSIEGEHDCVCSQEHTVLETLTAAGIYLEADCGGRGTCGKCKITVLAGKVANQCGQTVMDLPDGSYLACRVYPQEDMVVRIPRRVVSDKGTQIPRLLGECILPITKYVIVLNCLRKQEHVTLQEAVSCLVPGQRIFFGNITALQQFAYLCASASEMATLVLFDDEIIAVEDGDTRKISYGISFDIGTTTVVGMLIDLNNRQVVATHTETNPQVAFGADVISRIRAAATYDGLVKETTAIRVCLNRIINQLCSSANISKLAPYMVTICGNTTMEHLLLGICPDSLVRTPYKAVFRHVRPLDPADLELQIHPQGKIVLLPNIAGFIGADTTAAILAADMDTATHPTLLIDLGTNGELVIGNRGKLWACSTACGPAFEGSHIRDGMRASIGAIMDVEISDNVTVKTIGGGKAAGICGSGIVKAIAQLLDQGVVTETGRFNLRAMSRAAASLQCRLKQREGQWEFVLVEAEYSASGKDIAITQNDIRQVQLVKSSIRTGIEILFERSGLRGGILVFLAGAFGNYLDVDSALRIGMLSSENQTKIRSIGNAAGTGSVQTLLSTTNIERCKQISEKVQYVDLTEEPSFQSRFIANLNFPKVVATGTNDK